METHWRGYRAACFCLVWIRIRIRLFKLFIKIVILTNKKDCLLFVRVFFTKTFLIFIKTTKPYVNHFVNRKLNMFRSDIASQRWFSHSLNQSLMGFELYTPLYIHLHLKHLFYSFLWSDMIHIEVGIQLLLLYSGVAVLQTIIKAY